MELKSEKNVFFGSILILIILYSFLVLGFTGLKTILGLLIVMFLPVYAIFNNFNLEPGEKAIFSFFTTIMLFPSLVYWLGFIVPFKIAIFAVFAVLLSIGLAIYKFRKKKEG